MSLGALLLVPLVFSPVLLNGWVNWDDPLHVLDNPFFQPLSWSSLRSMWLQPSSGLYVPLSYMLFAMETVFGRGLSSSPIPHAIVFHATSVLLHTLCAVFVYRLLLRLDARPPLAAMGTAIFAVHPLQVESVAWISEQRGLLAAVLSLVALDVALREPTRAIRWPLQATAASLAFGLALLSKPSAVVTPMLGWILVAAHQTWPTDTRRRLAALFIGWLLLAGGAAVATSRLQPVPDAVATNPMLRPLLAANVLAFYVEKAVLPVGLCVDYGLTPRQMLDSPVATVRMLAVVGGLLAVFTMPRLAALRLPTLLFVVPLLPVLGFVPFTFEVISVVADRYAYLALVGVAAAVVAGLRALKGASQRQAATAAVGIVIATLSLMTIRQIPVWHDAISINHHAARINGGTSHTLINYGMALMDMDRVDEAAPLFEAAIERTPSYPRAHFNLGVARHRTGRLEDAERHYLEAIRLDRRYILPYVNLGILLAEVGRREDARAILEAARVVDPSHPGLRRNLLLLDGVPPQTP